LTLLIDILALVGVIAIIVGFVLLIMRLAKSKSVNSQGVPGTLTAPAAGWYPDPNDSSIIRYFDGQVWTSFTQPQG
jgi:hypothetical protein